MKLFDQYLSISTPCSVVCLNVLNFEPVFLISRNVCRADDKAFARKLNTKLLVGENRTFSLSENEKEKAKIINGGLLQS